MTIPKSDKPAVPVENPLAKQPESISDRLVVMLAHERSGTHFVADMLKSPTRFLSLDEVCNFNAVDPTSSIHSFFRFRHEYLVKNPDFSLRPNHENLTAFCDAFFSHLLSTTGAGNVLVDIKYGHVHNFEIGWWPSERRPFLLKYLEERKVRVLHLVRQDTVAAALSNFVAKETGIWHKRPKTPDNQPKRLKVPCQKVVHEALELEREKDNFFNWLSGNRCVQVSYEDCSSDARRPHAMNAICRFLGMEERPEYVSTYRKVTPDPPDIVENYEELQRVIGLFGQGRLRSAPSE